MGDDFKQFWAVLGGAVGLGFGFLTIGLILKDQTGAANILGAGGTQAVNVIGALAKVG